MKGHVVVCGLGHVGYRIVDMLLRLGESAAVIASDAREDWLAELSARGALVVRGDASQEKNLRAAGVATAKAVIAATDDDQANIASAFDAKRLNPGAAIVVRLFDQQLARRMESAFGIRRALGVSALAAPAFAAAALGEEALGLFSVGSSNFVAASMSAGRAGTVGRLSSERGVMAVAVRGRGRLEIGPGPQTTLEADDEVIVIGPASQWTPSAGAQAGRASALSPRAWPGAAIKLWRGVSPALRFLFTALMGVFLLSIAVFQRGLGLSPLDALYFVVTVFTTIGFGDISLLHAGPAVKVYGMFVMVCGAALFATLFSIVTDFIVRARFQDLKGQRQVIQGGHVVVAGLGNVGYRTVLELLRAAQRVAVVEKDAGSPFIELVRDKVHVILGDAALEEVLEKAGAAGAQAVIAATNNAVANLSIALTTRQLNKAARVVLRVFDADFGRKVKDCLAVDAVISASAAAAPAFVGAALLAEARHAFVIDGHALFVLHKNLGAPSTARQIEQEEGSRVLFRRSSGGGDFRGVAPDEPLSAGDECLLITVRRLAAAPAA